jgi:hypothetical protein
LAWNEAIKKGRELFRFESVESEIVITITDIRRETETLI